MGHIVWLASYPKSGNTWLRAFLKSFLDPAGIADINRLFETFPYEIDSRFYQRLDPRPVTELTRAETLALRPRVQRLIASVVPSAVFVKTHSARVVEGGFPLIDPEVTRGAIYLVRNPLDVVVSFSAYRGTSIDETIDLANLSRAEIAASEFAACEHFGSWSENVASWTRPQSATVHVVQYEHMIESPRKTFGAIIQHLGIPASRGRLERAMKRSSFRVLREQERRDGFIEGKDDRKGRFFRVGQPGQWRTALTAQQIERIVRAHHSEMSRFGYIP
jgi:hypothetical protein